MPLAIIDLELPLVDRVAAVAFIRGTISGRRLCSMALTEMKLHGAEGLGSLRFSRYWRGLNLLLGVVYVVAHIMAPHRTCISALVFCHRNVVVERYFEG